MKTQIGIQKLLNGIYDRKKIKIIKNTEIIVILIPKVILKNLTISYEVLIGEQTNQEVKRKELMMLF